jgi:hypothetical protein
MRASRVPVDVMIEASVLAVQPFERRLGRLRGGSLTHRTILPFV